MSSRCHPGFGNELLQQFSLLHLAERQTALYRCQISGLESTVSSYNHKVKNHIVMLSETAEQEALILKLADREKIIDIVRLQIESSIQTTTQHSDTITKLQQENSFLINQHKQEIQLLKAELVQNKSDLVCLERERQQLQASVTEQNQRIQQETLEKQQVIKQLELQRMQLFDLISRFCLFHHKEYCYSLVLLY
ncbi:hypothetical protein XENOCAPTIV_014802 [Xenoophorus captivus]|uniref:Uncharacterized protein n=1 Tax=Xenoophorus captivus TaxID=1517983 RepID=A0ABV0Q552_9TELE